MANNNKNFIKFKVQPVQKHSTQLLKLLKSHPTMLVSKLREVISRCIFQICVAHSTETLSIRIGVIVVRLCSKDDNFL